MTGIHPIQSVKASWNNASKAKKAAMVTGAVVATGAVAATVAAAIKGKNTDEAAKGLSKFGKKMANGYSQVFEAVKAVPGKIAGKFKKAEKVEETVTETVANAAEKAEEVVAEVVEKAE